MNCDTRVAVDRCEEYDVEAIKALLLDQLKRLEIDPAQVRGKKVVIKPNLVMKTSPEKAATTHPAVVEAAVAILCENGALVTIAESPGGLYTPALMEGFYKTCGLADIAARWPVTLNLDTGFEAMRAEDASFFKEVNIIKPVCEADYIVNIAKLKTHTFMMLSAAVKNLFGTIPGIQKFEMHARFKQSETFAGFVNELTHTLCEKKKVFHIVDAVVAMQGNGPTGGSPLKVGGLLSGVNPFAVDCACAAMLGLDEGVVMQDLAQKRGWAPTFEQLDIRGVDPRSLRVAKLELPDTHIGKKFELIPQFLTPHPMVDPKICVGCGECARNCPEHTIRLAEKKNGKKVAQIDRRGCIRCYCCQELCRFRAIRIKKNIIYRLIK